MTALKARPNEGGLEVIRVLRNPGLNSGNVVAFRNASLGICILIHLTAHRFLIA
jgi:hypothetical protein